MSCSPTSLTSSPWSITSSPDFWLPMPVPVSYRIVCNSYSMELCESLVVRIQPRDILSPFATLWAEFEPPLMAQKISYQIRHRTVLLVTDVANCSDVQSRDSIFQVLAVAGSIIVMTIRCIQTQFSSSAFSHQTPAVFDRKTQRV